MRTTLERFAVTTADGRFWHGTSTQNGTTRRFGSLEDARLFSMREEAEWIAGNLNAQPSDQQVGVVRVRITMEILDGPMIPA
ncbi:MAG: hypothetical protein ACE15D_16405 [Candidatus Eisenbacteria bacterium]|nr:hypothetical protein [Candidatus Eisenbacteria bacterium]